MLAIVLMVYCWSESTNPRQLLSEEPSHAGQPAKLGQLGAVSKGIRQPESCAPCSEPTLEVSLTENKLTRQALSARHVGVVLDPTAADVLKLSLMHLLAYPFECLGVQILEPLVLLS